MFNGCVSLSAIPKLQAEILAESCYAYMFKDCLSLTLLSSFAATELAQSCCKSMFEGCWRLLNVPRLSATTLVDSCYANMFNGCNLLSKVRANFRTSELLENRFSEWLYNTFDKGVFINYNLESIEISENKSIIPTQWKFINNNNDYVEYLQDLLTESSESSNSSDLVESSESSNSSDLSETAQLSLSGNIQSMLNFNEACHDYCYYYLFNNCEYLYDISSLRLSSMVLGRGCYEGMFSNCINITEAPELPAINLADDCYEYMFGMCANLNIVKVGFMEWSENDISTYNWLSGVASIGTFWCYK
jgi:hypothetical protein